jgi:hypothetical protein
MQMSMAVPKPKLRERFQFIMYYIQLYLYRSHGKLDVIDVVINSRIPGVPSHG